MTIGEGKRQVWCRRNFLQYSGNMVIPLPAQIRCTAWGSEIESLTSLNPSLIELDCRKTRRRQRVTAALAPRKSCFLPCNANLHAISASLKPGLPNYHRHRLPFSNDPAFY